MAGNIFISYRRGEDSGFAGRLFDSLHTVFDSSQLFMDVDSIEPGTNFVRVLQEKIADSDIVLAIIGRSWVDAADSNGNRRLDNPKDFVRTEIEAALSHKKVVIPVLVGNAEMPTYERLPESLRVLTEIHALRINHERYRADAEGLIKSLKKILDRPPREQADKSETAPDNHGPVVPQEVRDTGERFRLLQDELEHILRSPQPMPASLPEPPQTARPVPQAARAGEGVKSPGKAAEPRTWTPPQQSARPAAAPRVSKSNQSNVSSRVGAKQQRRTILLIVVTIIAAFAVSAAVFFGASIRYYLTPEKPAAHTDKAPPEKTKFADRIALSSPEQTASAPPRVLLHDEDPSDPKGRQYAGTVVWSIQPIDKSGKSSEIAVHADIDIPDRKLKMTMSFQRNTDTSLPASHTAELTFILPKDFAGGGVSNVPGILMKSTEPAQGTPIAGIAVKVTDGIFLVGLSNVDADRARNIQLLKERSWVDIPLVYGNQRRAMVTIEKGAPGERAFNDAFAAWGE
jgi:hypothetical protein